MIVETCFQWFTGVIGYADSKYDTVNNMWWIFVVKKLIPKVTFPPTECKHYVTSLLLLWSGNILILRSIHRSVFFLTTSVVASLWGRSIRWLLYLFHQASLLWWPYNGYIITAIAFHRDIDCRSKRLTTLPKNRIFRFREIPFDMLS